MTTTQEALKKELETLRTAFTGNSSEARQAPREKILNALIQKINSYKTPLTFEQFLNFHHDFCSKNFNLTQCGKKEIAYQQFIQTMHRILDGYGKDLSIEEYGLLKNMLADPHCAFNEELKTRLSQIVSLGDGRYKVAFKSGLKEELETLKAALTANKVFSFGRRDAREKTLEELSTKINTYGNQLTFAQFLDFYSQFCSQDFKLTQRGKKEIAYQQFLEKLNGALHSCSKNLSVEEHAALKRDLQNPACPFNEDLKKRLRHITTVDTKKYQPAFDLMARLEVVKQACIQKKNSELDAQKELEKSLLEKSTAQDLIIDELKNSVVGVGVGVGVDIATKLTESKILGEEIKEIKTKTLEKQDLISRIDEIFQLANSNIISLQNSRWLKGTCDPTSGIFSDQFNQSLAVCYQMERNLGLTLGQNQLSALRALNADTRKPIEKKLATLISCTQQIEIMETSVVQQPISEAQITLIMKQKKLNDELLALVQNYPSLMKAFAEASFLPIIFTATLKEKYLHVLEEKEAKEESQKGIQGPMADEVSKLMETFQAPLASLFSALEYKWFENEQKAISAHLQTIIQAHVEFLHSAQQLNGLETSLSGYQGHSQEREQLLLQIRLARQNKDINEEVFKTKTADFEKYLEQTINLEQQNAKSKQALESFKAVLGKRLGGSLQTMPNHTAHQSSYSRVRDKDPYDKKDSYDELEARFMALQENGPSYDEFEAELAANQSPSAGTPKRSIFSNTLRPLLIPFKVQADFFNAVHEPSTQAEIMLQQIRAKKAHRVPFSIALSAFQKQAENVCAANENATPREKIRLLKESLGGEKAQNQAAAIYQFLLLLEKEENNDLLERFDGVEPLTASKTPGLAAEDAVVIRDIKRMSCNLGRGVEIYVLQNESGKFAFRGELTKPGGQGEKFVWAALDHMAGSPSEKSDKLIPNYSDQSLGQILDDAYQTGEAEAYLAAQAMPSM